RLAERLRKQAEAMNNGESPGAPSKKELRDLANDLDTPEGEQRLEDMLKKLAEAPDPEGEESERQKALDDAEDGAGQAEKQLGGGLPVPIEAGGQGKPGPKGKGTGSPGKDNGQAQSGHSEGGGPGDHKGETATLDVPGVRARASGKLNAGKPMPGVVSGRSAGRAGETANVQGTG